jgi:NADPH-dependent glutamate synthase beta subunit-like oxidoreductase/NAD(P)H-flavin reductase
MTANAAAAALYAELSTPEGLARLDERFLAQLTTEDAALAARLARYRDATQSSTAIETSELLLALAPRLEDFVTTLFGIQAEMADLQTATLAHDPVLLFKEEFVKSRTRKYRGQPTLPFAELDVWLTAQAAAHGSTGNDEELATARYAASLLAEPQVQADALDRLTQWCILARDAHPERVHGWESFRLPQPVDHAQLVPMQAVKNDPAGRRQGNPAHFRRRDGFALTDRRWPARTAQGETGYCVYCHDHDGDFCSKGFPEKKKKPELGLKVNPLGEVMTGCPLEEKISEMHLMKRRGRSIAALAVAMADNPMIPATGHRICNDCMKACIYQKQDPVNIPQIETRVLTDVLGLPWGVEVYHLLARWNPLRRDQPVMQPFNGRRVLISGMGPAGFSMAHHLTMAGCQVAAIDGLKLEPLPPELLTGPVRDWSALEESLDSRTLAGFGGVAEYGITVRWDKNFLKLIYLTLARRGTFQAHGGVRLGGTVTLDDAWRLGFDHVCYAHGAGLPRVVPMQNSLARGMRQANDFLMALQLTGAAKHDSLASLQVRMPVVVIGGGLTAIDAATEAQTYYIRQVEKTLERHEALTAQQNEQEALPFLDAESRAVLHEFLEHGRAVRAERARAAAAGEVPDFISLLRQWGGVTVAYRRGMNESPAYLRNHEEIIKALEEGIYYADGLNPARAELDEFGHVKALVCRKMQQEGGRWITSREEVSLPARCVLVAAGATPNIIYEREHPGTLTMEDNHFTPHICHGDALQPARHAQHCKEPEFGPFTSYMQQGRTVTFLGDTHPVFNGSVVKAIASARRSWPAVMHALSRCAPTHGPESVSDFRERISSLLQPRVTEVRNDHPAVIELRVRAPLAARNFKPGQFFRLQTFERHSPVRHGTRLQIPLQTISGAGVDGDTVRLILLRMGANAQLAQRLQAGDPLVLMGPTGAPSHMGTGESLAVIAGRWGIAAMLAYGPALKAAGNRVLFIATLGGRDDIYYREELEAATDQIIWATAKGPLVEPARPQDIAVDSGDIVDLLARYGGGEWAAEGRIALGTVDELLVMGATGLLRALQGAIKDRLKPLLKPGLRATGVVGSPMQCMMKGVCAQCLQWQIDPATGERTRAVFSCSMQDQPLAWIDLDNLAARQSQNRLPEYLSSRWLSHLLARPE